MAKPPRSPATDDLGEEIDAINAKLANHETRIAALEAGGGTEPEPPDPEPPEPEPEPGDWPNDSNTGCTGTLQSSTQTQFTTADQVVENKSFRADCIYIKARGITFRNCKIECTGYWGIDTEGGDDFTAERCTIIGPAPQSANSAIWLGPGGTIRQCNISKFENGIVCGDGKQTIEDNYIHDLGGAAEAHVDGISVQGGQDGTVIRHNHVEAYDTSCVFLKCDFGPVKNTTIENNRLINAPGKKTAATVYSVSGNAGGGPPTGTKFLNNVMEKGNWYYWSLEGTVTRTGNTDYHTGQNIDGASTAYDADTKKAAEAKRSRSKG